MFKLFNIVEEKDSKINGKIQVVKDLQGARIIAGGVSQSGWLVKSVWKAAIKKVASEKKEVRKVLILGLGGGSAAELVAEYWMDTQIIGVDIDPQMVNMGKKYLHIGKLANLEIVITDAAKYLEQNKNNKKQKFDLVLVDLFNGSRIPAKFYTNKFIRSVKSVLGPSGVVAFNHLYSFYTPANGVSEKVQAQKLQRNLRKNFTIIKSVLPEANIIFLCFND